MKYLGTKLPKVDGKTREEKYDNFCEALSDLLYRRYIMEVASPELNSRASKFANRFLKYNFPIHHGKKLVLLIVVDGDVRGFRLSMII